MCNMVALVAADRIERILVTDAHELAGIGAVRSLGRAGYRVTGFYSEAALRADGMPPGLPPVGGSRYAAVVRAAPDPWTEQRAFAQALLAAARSGQFAALLPVSEAALIATQSIRAELPAELLLLMPRAEHLRYTLSKFHLNQAARQLGVPIPRTAFIFDGEPQSPWELSGLAGLRYPLIVKTDNHLLPGGQYQRGRTLLVREPAQTTAALLACREAGGAIIVQEHIAGRGAGAFVLRAHGQTLLRFAHRRLHEVPYTGGVSSLRASIHDPDLLALAERLLGGLAYEGVAMVEFRLDEAGRPFLMEINGRLWGSLALALHAGVDFPLAMVRAARGSTALTATATASAAAVAAPPDYPDGLRCRNVFPGELHYLRSVLGAPSAELGLGAKAAAVAEFLLLFLDPRVRYDYLWWQDPLPGIIQAAATALHLLDKQRGRPAHLLRQRRQKRQWADLVRAARLPPREPRPALFLCHGNICRSPFAAAYFNRQLQARGLAGPPAQSAGFVRPQDRRTPALLRGLAPAWGVDLGEHLSQPVTRELLEQAGALLVMDAENYDELLAFAGAIGPGFARSVRARVFPLGALLPQARPPSDPGGCQIADPYGSSPAVSHAVYKQLAAAVEALLTHWYGPAAA